jgi:hypothetical protein
LLEWTCGTGETPTCRVKGAKTFPGESPSHAGFDRDLLREVARGEVVAAEGRDRVTTWALA